MTKKKEKKKTENKSSTTPLALTFWYESRYVEENISVENSFQDLLVIFQGNLTKYRHWISEKHVP